MMKNQEIPKGLDHLLLIASLSDRTRKQSEVHLKKHSFELMMIGTALSALYQAATCHRKCHGGSHVLEALAGRVYNLACSAYSLITQGFYDEALNLIRSIGEISNLLSLSIADKEAIAERLSSDQRTRIKKFGPASVRQMLENSGGFIIADKDWYAEFCEKYTHVTPGTRPNLHNETGVPVAGGVVQERGIEASLGELSTILGSTAMIICRYFKLEDLLAEIASYIDSERKKP